MRDFQVAFEKRLLQQKGMKAAVGRNAYSTSLHCLLETVETYATYLQSRALAVRFVEECAELLTQFNADITKVILMVFSSFFLFSYLFVECTPRSGADSITVVSSG